MLIINPGTEAREGATEHNARTIANAICATLSIPPESLSRSPPNDDEAGGFFCFTLTVGDQAIQIDIPGDDPVITVQSRPFVSRRIYVDGSSWLYGYALDRIAEHLRGET